MEDRADRLRRLSEELHKLEGLVASKGWERLEKIAEDQCSLRFGEINGKLTGIDQVLGQEYEKGTIQGIKLFMTLPHRAIHDIKLTLAEVEREEDERPDERPDTVPEPGDKL